MKKIMKFVCLLALLCGGCDMNSNSGSTPNSSKPTEEENKVYQLFEHKKGETETDQFIIIAQHHLKKMV